MKSTPWRKASAVFGTAAWPIMASMTNRTSSGWIAARIFPRPAAWVLVDRQAAGRVDDDDGVELLRASRIPASATAAGSPKDRVPSMAPVTASCPAMLPRSGAKTGTPGALARPQLGDGIGALEVSGDEQWRLPLVMRNLPSLPAKGRLPEPGGRQA